MSGRMFKLPEGGKYYDDGDVITEAGLEFKVIATPGHTPGGVSLICENALSRVIRCSVGAAAERIFPAAIPKPS